jgi:methylmalonyl-CoA mutase
VPTAVHRAVGADTGSFRAALESAHGGISASELVEILRGSDEKDAFSPVVMEREARPFEVLRDLSDEFFSSTGVRPRAFVASLGKAADNRATIASVSNLLAAGGLMPVLGEDLESTEAMAAAFAASGSRTAVICASSEKAREDLPIVAREIKALRARRVLYAGKPGRLESAWREAGVDGFIQRGMDVVKLLSELLEAEGVENG